MDSRRKALTARKHEQFMSGWFRAAFTNLIGT
jgi:hypothetical protein